MFIKQNIWTIRVRVIEFLLYNLIQNPNCENILLSKGSVLLCHSAVINL